MSDNTLFLRLAGPMQSWGTSSRLQIRRSDAYPSKSGVWGLLLCATGVRREESATHLTPLASMTMGVRVDRPGTMDEVKVKVEVRPELFSDEMRQMQALHDRIDREIQSVTGVRMTVELVKPQTLERSMGKAQRVVDHRRARKLI